MNSPYNNPYVRFATLRTMADTATDREEWEVKESTAEEEQGIIMGLTNNHTDSQDMDPDMEHMVSNPVMLMVINSKGSEPKIVVHA